jgi:MFS family permease
LLFNIHTVSSIARARFAVKALFFLNGFVHANLFSRLPRIQDQFRIDNGTIGIVLLAASFGALIAMPFTGWAIIRNGSRRIVLYSAYLYCAFVPFIPFAPNLPMLIILFFAIGISTGMLDVAMNSQAVMIEQQWGKPIMTSFHAFFSIGMMLGAMAGAGFSTFDTPLKVHLIIIGIVSLATVFVARYFLIVDAPASKEPEGPAFRLPNAAMVGIGIIAFCCMLGEGAMADWSTNYMENIAHASKSMAPLGLSAFALAMTVGRVFGDSARLRYGDRKLMVICGLISAAGLTLSILVTDPTVVIAGFFIVGLGLSAVVPIAYSVAGSAKGLPPGVGLAMVTTVGYAGFLFGPPIIGFIADLFTLRLALLLVLALFAIMTLLAYRYRQDI